MLFTCTVLLFILRQEPYYLLAYGIFLLLTHAPLVGAVLLLTVGCCCSRLFCPRGNMRPLRPKDSILTCYGHCDPSEVHLFGSGPVASKPEKPYATDTTIYESDRRAGSVPAVLVRGARPGDDFDAQEEKVGFLL